PVRSAIREAARLARELDLPVAFDVNFREHLWSSVEKARKVVDPLFDDSYIVKLSDDELSPLLGVEETEAAAQKLLERGVSLVLVSMGPKGAFYATREFTGSVPAFEVEVVDATGAGDAFLAAALAHLSEGPEGSLDEERVREATRRGTAAGAIACTDYGAMRALPSKGELERFMNGG
ncbi:MAG TPA: PfkB family carbohydrate kinase, partial [Rubrobacteraceae bacterium]|nr:PfkB family carbohydrate kinase [Rubrobacteraceae bacterium]